MVLASVLRLRLFFFLKESVQTEGLKMGLWLEGSHRSPTPIWL
jgi:hypothetical protein